MMIHARGPAMTIDTIYLVNHTHTDFGYTDYPDTLYRQHRRIIDDAIEVCEANAHRADPSRFRWTCEVAEITVDWLRHAPASQIDRFKALHAAGLMGVAAMPMHWTPLLSPALAERSLDLLRTLRHDYGLTVRTAWQCDVNGLTWYWTDLLLNAGVERLLFAPNPHRGMADPLGPHLFNWETPSGRILPTLHGWHYSCGTNTFFLSDFDNAKSQSAFDRVLARVQAAGTFPHPHAIVQVTNVASPDNGFPSASLPDVVEKWNAEGRSPRFEIRTLDQAMDLVQSHAGPVPTASGDWPDYWADGVGSTAFETAIARTGERLIPATDMLNALDGADAYATEAQSSAAHDLMMYDEHTWGAYSAITHPDSPFTRFQWSWKTHRAQQGFANAFEALTQAARNRARKVTKGRVESDVTFRRNTLPPTPVTEQTYYLFNPTPYPRRVHWPVAADLGGAAPGTLLHAWLIDRFLPGMFVERYGTGHAPGHILTADLPPYGEAVVAPTLITPAAHARTGLGWIETDRWHLAINPATGAIASLIDRASGADWAPGDHPTGILLRETLARPDRGRSAIFGTADTRDWSRLETLTWPDDPTPFHRAPGHCALGNARITVLGPEIDAILTFPNGDRATITWRLPFGDGGIDADVLIDKTPDTTPEAYYMLFSAPGHEPRVTLDLGDHSIDASQQLPQSCASWTAIQTFASVTTTAGALTVAAPDTPLVQPFGIQTQGAGSRTDTDPSLAFWVLNNHWDVNFAASQSGRIPARFRLLPQATPDAQAARAFASAACNPPVIVRSYDGVTAAPTPAVMATGDIILRLRPAPSGSGLFLTAVNPHDHAVTTTITLGDSPITRAQHTDALEHPGADIPPDAQGGIPVTLGPRQTRYIHLTR
jgi:alpha-mannosidase